MFFALSKKDFFNEFIFSVTCHTSRISSTRQTLACAQTTGISIEKSATKQEKKTPRVFRSFAQARIQDKYQRQEVSCTKVGDNDIGAGQTLVPGMSLYEFSQVSDAESQAVGDEEPMIFDS